MRLTRGFLGSLGASTSLVLAATVALFSVSTIVAFRGWPGMEPAVRGPGEQRIAVSNVDRSGSAAAQRIVIPRAAAPSWRRAASPPAASRTSAARNARVVVTRPAQPVRRNVPAATTATPKATPAAQPHAVRPPRKDPVPGDPVRKVGSGLGGALSGAAGGLGDAVRPASPALGETLDQVGSGLDRTVRDLSGAVGLMLDTILRGAGTR